MRIAYVIPWFGADLKGGAEQHAWQFATRLAARGHAVDALTTCCRSYMDDWTVNNVPEGIEHVEGVTVRRFPVDPRDRAAFDRLNERLLALSKSDLRPGICPVPPEMAKVWTQENINSRALEEYLATSGKNYDAVVFIPYLYGPTLRGWPFVRSNAWMQPCLHDEAYAYLPDSAAAMHGARGLLFNSLGEQALAARLYGPAVLAKGHVTGGGVEFSELDEHRDAQLPGELLGTRFVLFLGRRESEKGVEFLVDAFKSARAKGFLRDMKLVLAGPGRQSHARPEEGIIDLGLVTDKVRVALLRDCALLAIPSRNESFSRVLYEAWYLGKPVLVRQSCDATRMVVEECSGGWVAESSEDWAALLHAVAGDSATDDLTAMALRGQGHVRRAADWEHVLDHYESVLGDPARMLAAAVPASRPSGRDALKRNARRDPEAIHQLSPNLGYGDAISNEMLEIREMLRSAGYRSEIVATFVDPALVSQATVYRPDAIKPDEGLIYHHSIGAAVTVAALEHPGPKGLVYHNITPAEHFRPYRPDFSKILRSGREDLWSLAGAFEVSVGDSRYNAAELERFGFASPGVLPLSVDPIGWDLPPSQAWMERLSDGRRNVLFVGRVAPNKRQDRLVEAFSMLRAMTDVRLVLAGSAPPGDPYAEHVRGCIRNHGLEDSVIVTGHCALPDLHAFYRCADLFWSFSEHEGFCVPLIEAMWFDVPVVALASSAVPETLEGSGLPFAWGDDNFKVAALALSALRDEKVRARVLAGQRQRRMYFNRRHTRARLAEFVERILEKHRQRNTVAA